MNINSKETHRESHSFNKGSKIILTNISGVKVGFTICYDLRFPVFSRNTIDYHLLIYLANWPTKRNNAWNALLRARSIENQI